VVDVFEEVEEELRSERYRALVIRVLPWAAGALAIGLAIALGVWGFDTWRTQAANRASEQYAQAMEDFDQGQADQANALWAEVAKSPAKGYASLSLQHLGAAKLAANQTAEAVKLFDQAASEAPDYVIGDAARLKSAFALLDTASLKDMQTRLDPLMKEGRPYRTEAREALAFAKLQAGDLAGARGEFVVISLLPDAQQTARERARAAMALIDSGSAKATSAAVKAALALPPQPLIAPGAGVAGPAARAQQEDPNAQ
jgi:hypothetical protein